MNIPCKFRPIGNGGLLPGYTRLDFLESSGSQYINTSIYPDEEVGVNVMFSIYAQSTGGNVFGSGVNNYNSDLLRLAWSSRLLAYRNNRAWVLVNPVPKDEPINAHIGAESIAYNGKVVATFEKLDPFVPEYGPYPIYMFASSFVTPKFGACSIYAFQICKSEKSIFNAIPALDSIGRPCMFDTVSKQSFENDGSGQFIAGVKNASQLRAVLRKLPDLTGQDMGTLTLSIPAEANTPEMQELLDSTEVQKNWELTIQERAAEVATYSLRRVRKVVWVRKLSVENGSYVDASGLRWQTEWCSAIYSPLGNDPTLHGYEPFDSVEQAVEAWGLVPYEEQELEQEEP